MCTVFISHPLKNYMQFHIGVKCLNCDKPNVRFLKIKVLKCEKWIYIESQKGVHWILYWIVYCLNKDDSCSTYKKHWNIINNEG